MQRLKLIPNFNFHSKYENLSFADDLLLFARGDTTSICLLMDTFEEFSKSTSLSVNSVKYKIYFGNVDMHTKQEIQDMTNFSEGTIPFRYLGILFTSKKLTIHQCLTLVDKTVARIRH